MTGTRMKIRFPEAGLAFGNGEIHRPRYGQVVDGWESIKVVRSKAVPLFEMVVVR